MLPTLREVLAMPSFAAADVDVLTGDPDAVTVRWVHSSEVYEMGRLLSGGEVLLTTGLGLQGRSSAQLAGYVDLIADAGCVALALEVGRTFLAVPDELVVAARRRGVVLLALHAVVPFERMVEDFHDLLLRRKLVSPSAAEPVWQELLGLVVGGQGMASLLAATARLADCPAAYVDLDGNVVERGGPPPSPDDPPAEVDVRGPSGSLGRLLLYGMPNARRTTVAERAVVAIALELGRHPDVRGRPSPAQAVVTDLATGLLTSYGDVAERLSSAGWVPVRGTHVLVAAVDVDQRTPVRDVLPAVEDAVQAVLGNCVVGAIGNHVLVLAHGWRQPLPARVRDAFTDVHERVTGCSDPHAVRAIGVATPVAELAAVADAVGQARHVLRLARRFGIAGGVLLARDVGVQRLLAESVDDAAQAEFVSEQLGSLIAFDVQHAGDLVRTLDALIAAGGRKSSTALALGIRRQSLYARLERIETLLGCRLDDPTQVQTLALALTAWRMRTGLDPQAAPPG